MARTAMLRNNSKQMTIGKKDLRRVWNCPVADLRTRCRRDSETANFKRLYQRAVERFSARSKADYEHSQLCEGSEDEHGYASRRA
jgi:hypothetical protein